MENYLTTDLESNGMCGYGLDSSHSAQHPKVNFCEQSSEFSDSVKGGNFLTS